MIRLAVVDVGTNSVRVLIADGDPRARTLQDRVRDLRITRLGQGVDASRLLAPDAIERTVAAIAHFVERCRGDGVERIRVTATSAVRDAANAGAFQTAVVDATGIEVEVLPGEHEARLGFAGATIAAPVPPPYLVCDIGGGSTELVAGAREVDAFVSMDIGSVRLTERHLRTDPPSEAEQQAVARDARAQIAAVRDRFDDVRAPTLVGLAGTITTVAALVLGLERYDRERVHHARLTRADVAATRERLATLPVAGRRALPVMPPGREDVIVAGALILEEVMDAFACGAVVVSETDILDGAALELLDRA